MLETGTLERLLGLSQLVTRSNERSIPCFELRSFWIKRCRANASIRDKEGMKSSLGTPTEN